MRRTIPSLLILTALLAACSATDAQVTRGTSATITTEFDTTDTSPGDTVPVDTTPSDTSPDDTAPVGTDERSSTLDWKQCDNAKYAPEVECATLSVPFDYDQPDGATIDLALTRLPATGTAVGSVLVNPGGPGGSGNEFLAENLAFDPSEFGDLTDTYDLVGFDPRGVGESAPIDCVDNAWLDAHEFLDPTPDTPEEQAALDDSDREFAAGCVAHTTGDLAQYDTKNTARDMDRIRAALGDEQLTFYGASYGTFLGGVYATLFPDNVRAMVLDGAYYPADEDAFTSIRTQWLGFEGAFTNWANDCQANAACPFHADDVGARWLALRTELDQSPLPASAGRQANEAAVVDATIAALYDKSSWDPLSQALAAAEQGDPTALVTLADLYAGREADGTWSNLNEANQVLNCTSGLVGTTTPTDLAAKVDALHTEAPHFGYDVRVEDFTDPCAGLPTEPAETITYSGPAPILVTGGKNDPATPFVYAEKLSTALGSSASLITYTGEGHTSMGSSSCVSDAGVAVLRDASAAPTGLVCDQDPPPSAPDWFADLPTVDGLSPYEMEDAASLFGFPKGTYAKAFVSTASQADVTAAVKQSFDDAGWLRAAGTKIPIGDQNGDLVGELDGSHGLQIIVLGPEVMATPDLATLGRLLPKGATLVLYVVS